MATASPSAHKPRMAGPPALDPLRDPFGSPVASSPSASSSHKALLEQLQRNANDHSIKLGPSMEFHNHAAALLTCIYRMGGTADEITAVLDSTPELSGLQPALPAILDIDSRADDSSNTPIITKSNWEQHLGGFGVYGLGAHQKFPVYHAFFEREIKEHGGAATLATFLPRLSKGLAGDFFHALIELGYHFESQSAALLPVGLAWMAAAYAEIPGPSSHTTTMFESPVEALAALSKDPYVFPVFNLHDGSSGYIAALEDLAADHSDAVLQYELTDFPTYDKADANNAEDAIAARACRLQDIIRAATDSFAAGGCTDFYILHLITGGRAVWAIIEGAEDDIPVPLSVQDDLLRSFWRATLYTHVSRNRPWPPPGSDDANGDATSRYQPWTDIILAGRTSQNSHITKVIMNCADFWDKWGDDRFWRTADAVVVARNKGQKLIGTGPGSKMERFTKK